MHPSLRPIRPAQEEEEEGKDNGETDEAKHPFPFLRREREEEGGKPDDGYEEPKPQGHLPFPGTVADHRGHGEQKDGSKELKHGGGKAAEWEKPVAHRYHGRGALERRA